jgi:hypothetical protein
LLQPIRSLVGRISNLKVNARETSGRLSTQTTLAANAYCTLGHESEFSSDRSIRDRPATSGRLNSSGRNSRNIPPQQQRAVRLTIRQTTLH